MAGKSFDVAIVGARCAGSPTAMLLARKGYRVPLVDRSTFPSDTISTHIAWQAGAARLDAEAMIVPGEGGGAGARDQ